MENVVWLVILVPVSLLFTGIGIYAWRREKPMWFWSGTVVRESEIRDIRAYNRANGIMWLAFSGVFWGSAALGALDLKAAGVLLFLGCAAGVPVLPLVYGWIRKKYGK